MILTFWRTASYRPLIIHSVTKGMVLALYVLLLGLSGMDEIFKLSLRKDSWQTVLLVAIVIFVSSISLVHLINVISLTVFVCR